MTGSITIDNVDIYSAYNATLLKGGDIDLMTFPECKEPESNNWFEQNGADVDLSEIYYKEKTVTMLFYLKSSNSREFIRNLDQFYRQISAPGYRTIYLQSLLKSFQLRYISCPSYQQRGFFTKSGTKSAQVSVVFSMDDPLQVISEGITTPVSSTRFLTYVEINNIDLSQYGIIVNNIYNTSLILPAQKGVLTQESAVLNGIISDVDSPTTYEPFDIIINCTMLAGNINEFYTNYSALFALLSSTNALKLRCSAAIKSTSCYYVKQDNFIKAHAFDSSINVSFHIVLKSIDFKLLEYLLGSEARQIIMTEDGRLLKLA